MYSPEQVQQFKSIGARQDAGEITPNQAYKEATEAGFAQPFTDWLNQGRANGWIDKEWMQKPVEIAGKKISKPLVIGAIALTLILIFNK